MNNKFINDLVEYLTDKYSCHSIILYGSYKNGSFTRESDVDLICFSDSKGSYNDTEMFQNKKMDVWIYNSKMLKKPKNFLHLNDSTLLIDTKGLGKDFLLKINQIYKKGPKVLPDNEVKFLKSWLMKMYQRVKKGDIEGNYRYHWLLFDSLEIYFKFRNLWYLGPKKSLEWLSLNDKVTYILFDSALKINSKISDLEKLINKLIDL
jgi:predicted nucleotidyltransferase